jgi:hypothetical protein
MYDSKVVAEWKSKWNKRMWNVDEDAYDIFAIESYEWEFDLDAGLSFDAAWQRALDAADLGLDSNDESHYG